FEDSPDDSADGGRASGAEPAAGASHEAAPHAGELPTVSSHPPTTPAAARGQAPGAPRPPGPGPPERHRTDPPWPPPLPATARPPPSATTPIRSENRRRRPALWLGHQRWRRASRSLHRGTSCAPRRGRGAHDLRHRLRDVAE